MPLHETSTSKVNKVLQRLTDLWVVLVVEDDVHVVDDHVAVLHLPPPVLHRPHRRRHHATRPNEGVPVLVRGVSCRLLFVLISVTSYYTVLHSWSNIPLWGLLFYKLLPEYVLLAWDEWQL